MNNLERVQRTLTSARERLLAERSPLGIWEGQLSSSALSTAIACATLALGQDPRDQPRIQQGLAWLTSHQNEDGGFGDTPDSPSNLSTSALAWMALGCAEGAEAARELVAVWLRERLGVLDSEHLALGLREVYGKDHTFAIPILVACAVGGCFDEADDPWAPIARLPFEMAALPRGLFKWLGLSVVSYALPALIAIGQAIEHHKPSSNPFARALRRWTAGPTLKRLKGLQPPGGGFLEATPLTGFVVLSLISSGHRDHPVALQGLGFLRNSMRADGAWPIDTDLSIWLTCLASGALATDGRLHEHLDQDQRSKLIRWLCERQEHTVHPYTGADPGGWPWTHHPGGVPDADDTSAALLALYELNGHAPEPGGHAPTMAGALWLCNLQNRDGGLPTFCRGWGKLPFDASSPDLTAHALRAWQVLEKTPGTHSMAKRLRRARNRAQGFLVQTQWADGCWIPLWFGNQHTPEGHSPVYGTSRVLRACSVPGSARWNDALLKALDWLLTTQNADGGFGGAASAPSSIEETALALEALVAALALERAPGPRHRSAISRAAQYLTEATELGTQFPAQPIGLYFAKLWYSEKLYPLIFTVSALGACAAQLESDAFAVPLPQ